MPFTNPGVSPLFHPPTSQDGFLAGHLLVWTPFFWDLAFGTKPVDPHPQLLEFNAVSTTDAARTPVDLRSKAVWSVSSPDQWPKVRNQHQQNGSSRWRKFIERLKESLALTPKFTHHNETSYRPT